MRWDVKLAKELKKRNNKAPMGPQIGEVISVNPLSISILGNRAIITSEHCRICGNLVESYTRKADITYDSITNESEIVYKEILKAGDKVLCLPNEDGQLFFIIDKVVI